MPVVAGSMPSSRERSSVPDLLGAAVLVCCVAWALISAAGRGSARPEGMLLALFAVVAGYAAGRVAGAILPVAAPATAGLAVVGVILAVPNGLSGEPIAPPLGYGNADAALLALASGAACCAAWDTRSLPVRLALRGLTVVMAGMALAIGSVAAGAACLGVLFCSLAAARMDRRLMGLVGLALCAALAVGTTVAVASDALPDSAPLRTQLTERRVELWTDALRLARQNPVRGVGPDRFAELSEVAPRETDISDPDPGRPPSAALQQAAEEGVPGVALLAGAYLWMLFALWRSSRSTPVVLTAAAALTGLAVQASVDSVLSYTAVTAGAGLMAGMATARPLAEDHAPESDEPDVVPLSGTCPDQT
jgi:O-Antigen ligase